MDMDRNINGHIMHLWYIYILGQYYWHWKQKINPLDSSQNTSTGVGYYVDQSLHVSWTGFDFQGISLSSSQSQTFFDCSYEADTWYYTIGAKCQYKSYTNKFPGPLIGESEADSVVSEVYLWIRVTPEAITRLRLRTCLCKRSLNQFFHFFILIAS